jgi:hypothetical protein
MSDAPRIVMRPSPGVAPETACDVRARAWSFIFACCRKKAAESNGGDNDGKAKGDSADEHSIRD